jgi:hypothetical protein
MEGTQVAMFQTNSLVSMQLTTVSAALFVGGVMS